MKQTLEQLNNAIHAAAAPGAGSRSPFWTRRAIDLNDDWQDWYGSAWWRSLGPLQLPFTVGTVDGYWARYVSLYGDASAEVQSRLPAPDDIQPEPLGDAASQAVEANADVVAAASAAASRGSDALRAVADRIDQSVKNVGYQATKATAGLAVTALAVLAIVYYLKK